MTLTFIESSAIVKLIVREEETRALKRWLARRDLVSSELARVEVTRAIHRTGLETKPTVDQVLGGIRLVAIDAGCLERAAVADPPALGTLDAIHLATALVLSDDLDAFVTYDRRLGNAAAAAGLPVETPR